MVYDDMSLRLIRRPALLHNILVPLDGSAFGEHALPLALSLARAASARLLLLHVHPPLEALYAEIQLSDISLETELRQRAKAYLNLVHERVKAVFTGPVTVLHADGDIAPMIRAEADKCHADLVVMTTHARGAFSRFWLGSVTDEMVRHSTHPIVLVHPKDHAADLSADRAPRHILVPLDGSEFAEHILEEALRLGQLGKAEFTLLRVVRPALPVAIPPDPGAIGVMAEDMALQIDLVQAQLQQEASAYLQQVAAKVRSRGLVAHTRVVLEDQPAEAILDAAASPIDFIALQTHGRGGVARLLLGSVSDKVIRASHVPVLVQRPRA
jgi:nucleotide-binding universal stress UspA family protein